MPHNVHYTTSPLAQERDLTRPQTRPHSSGRRGVRARRPALRGLTLTLPLPPKQRWRNKRCCDDVIWVWDFAKVHTEKHLPDVYLKQSTSPICSVHEAHTLQPGHRAAFPEGATTFTATADVFAIVSTSIRLCANPCIGCSVGLHHQTTCLTHCPVPFTTHSHHGGWHVLRVGSTH